MSEEPNLIVSKFSRRNACRLELIAVHQIHTALAYFTPCSSCSAVHPKD